MAASPGSCRRAFPKGLRAAKYIHRAAQPQPKTNTKTTTEDTAQRNRNQKPFTTEATKGHEVVQDQNLTAEGAEHAESTQSGIWPWGGRGKFARRNTISKHLVARKGTRRKSVQLGTKKIFAAREEFHR